MAIKREYHRWYSSRLGHDMVVLSYGHWGAPLLSFPTSGGDEWEYENQGIVETLGQFIDGGRMKFISVGQVSGESFYNKGAHPFHRSYVQAQYDAYIRFEVVPFIWDSCKTPRNSHLHIRRVARRVPRRELATQTSRRHQALLRSLRPVRHEALHGRHVRRQFLFQ